MKKIFFIPLTALVNNFQPVRSILLYKPVIEQIFSLAHEVHLTIGDRFPSEQALQE